jgi:hypothetical protein
MSVRSRAFCGSAVLAMVLAGCGGGGGSHEPSATPTPAPTLTPAPTASPKPAPTPTPAYTYANPVDITRDFLASAQSIELRTVSRYRETAPGFYQFESEGASALSASALADISYTASEEAVRLRYSDDVYGTEDITFVRSDVVQRADVGRAWARNGDRFDRIIISKGFANTGSDLSYVGSGETTIETSFRDNISPAAASLKRERLFLFGSRTGFGDLPTQGSVTYSVYTDALGRNLKGIGGLSGKITIDFASRKVSGAVSANGEVGGPTPVATMFDGFFDPASSAISGSLSTADGSRSGQFTGYVFGTAANEMGFLFRGINSDGSILVGRVEGRRS